MTTSISLDTLNEALEIKESIAALEARLENILTGGGDLPFPFSLIVDKGPKTKSAAHRAKLAASARARWAKIKGTSTPADKPVVKSGRKPMSAAAKAKISAAAKARWAKVKGTSTLAPVKKKGGITPEGRARIVAALKKRWAAKRKK